MCVTGTGLWGDVRGRRGGRSETSVDSTEGPPKDQFRVTRLMSDSVLEDCTGTPGDQFRTLLLDVSREGCPTSRARGGPTPGSTLRYSWGRVSDVSGTRWSDSRFDPPGLRVLGPKEGV